MPVKGQQGWYCTLEGDFPGIPAGKDYPALIVDLEWQGIPPDEQRTWRILVFTPNGVFPKSLSENDALDIAVIQPGKFCITSGFVERQKLAELLGFSQGLIYP